MEIAITKHGLTCLSAPPEPDLEKFKTSKKITNEEILKILSQPLGRATGNKNKKKKPKKKAAKKVVEDDDDEESSDDE